MYLFKLVFWGFFGYLLRSRIAGSCGSSIFSFFEKPMYVFSTVAISIYIPTNSIQGFPSLHILTNICYLCSFLNSHSDRSKVISHCGFDLHFPNDWRGEPSFHVPLGHLHFLLGEISIQFLWPFSNWIVCLGVFFLFWDFWWVERKFTL